MSSAKVKIAVQIVGTLIGLLGGWLFVRWVVMMIATAGTILGTATCIGWGVALVIAAYCLGVCYLVWCRFSPLAVRHVCGSVGFALLGLAGTGLFLRISQTVEPQPWVALVLVGWLLLIRLLYRVISERLSRVLFPISVAPER